jgi:hypothetical protein
VSTLGVDGGIGTFGWAVVAPRTARVVACGVLVQKPDPKRHGGVHADRVYRAAVQAELLDRVITEHGVEHLAAEEMSFAPRGSAAAKIGIGLSWGNLIGLARGRLDSSVIVVPPKTWQRGIVPAPPGTKKNAAIDYDKVHAAIATYVDHVATGLDQVPAGQRNHAYDAVGIATYAELEVIKRAPAIHVERNMPPRAAEGA